MDRRLELSLLGGVLALVAGAATFCGQWLSRVVNPAPNPGPYLMSLVVATFLLTSVAAALALALICRVIALAGGFSSGFWTVSGLLLQDFALFLAVWVVLWGAPFALAMVVGLHLRQFLPQLSAMAVGVFAAIVMLVLFRRFISNDVWMIAGRYNPASQIGVWRMLLLLGALMIPARLHVDRCYTFDVAVADKSIATTEPLEVNVKVAGRITDHGRLRGALFPAENQRIAPLALHFTAEEPGSYLGIADVSKLRPGLYKLRVWFTAEGVSDRFAAWSSYGGIERQIIVRVRRTA